MVRSLAIALVCVVLAVPTALAQGDCQQVKISCSEAKRQNEAYCAGPRRVESGMSYDGCIASGEKAMRDCLQTGRWLSGRRYMCGLTKQ